MAKDKAWFIEVNDRPIYTSKEQANKMGWRGPYTKREVSELTGTSYDYLHADNKRCFSPDYPCKHPATRLYSWFAYDDTLCIACCDCGEVLKGAYIEE